MAQNIPLLFCKLPSECGLLGFRFVFSLYRSGSWCCDLIPFDVPGSCRNYFRAVPVCQKLPPGTPLCAPETTSLRPHYGRGNRVCGHRSVQQKHVGAPSYVHVRDDRMPLYAWGSDYFNSVCFRNNWALLCASETSGHYLCAS